jgi:hypothetical protein
MARRVTSCASARLSLKEGMLLLVLLEDMVKRFFAGFGDCLRYC